MRILHIGGLNYRSHIDGIPNSILENIISKNTEKIDLLVLTGSVVESPLFLVCDSRENTYFCNEDEWMEELNKIKEDYIDIKQFLDKIIMGDKDIPSVFRSVFGNTSESIIDSNEIQINVYNDNWCNWFGMEYDEMNDDIMDEYKRKSGSRRFDKEMNIFLDSFKPNEVKVSIEIQHYGIKSGLDKEEFLLYEKEMIKSKLEENSNVKHIILSSNHYNNNKTEKISVENNIYYSSLPSVTISPHFYNIIEIEKDKNIEIKNKSLIESNTKIMNYRLLNVNKYKGVVFIDRDGVISTLPAYYTGHKEMQIIENSGKGIELLHLHNYYVIVISNQSLIGSGFVSENTVEYTMDVMCKELKEESDSILGIPDKIIYPPNSKYPCHSDYSGISLCKPNSTLMSRILKLLDFDVDKIELYMIGDRISDMEAGLSIKCRCFYVRSSASYDNKNEKIVEVKDLYDACKIITKST